MNTYTIDGATIDSVDLKCLAVSRGLNVCIERDIWNYAASGGVLGASPAP